MPSTLSIGSQGDTVKLLQGALNNWPMSILPFLEVDGIFGSKTGKKVKEFQSKSNLDSDGVVGPLTWEQLKPFVDAAVKIFPIPDDELAAGERIKVGAELALATYGWLPNDRYSLTNPKIAAAKCADPNKPFGPGLRQGGQVLAQIFSVAEVSANKCSNISSTAIVKWQDQTPEGTKWRNNNDLVAWCGIFSVYILRMAGFSIPGGWNKQKEYVKEAADAFTSGHFGSVYRYFSDPKLTFPGCIGVKNDTTQHHFIITENRDGFISSVDGNLSGFGIDPDPKMKWDCKSIIGRKKYSYQELRNVNAYFLFPSPYNRSSSGIR